MDLASLKIIYELYLFFLLELLRFYEFVLNERVCLAPHLEVKLYCIALFVVSVFPNYYVLQVKLVDGVKAEGAPLPRLLLVVFQVLEDAGPAVDVTALCYSRAHH